MNKHLELTHQGKSDETGITARRMHIAEAPGLLHAMPVEEFLRISVSALPERATYYSVDLRRSTPESLWVSQGDGGFWFEIPGAAIAGIQALGSSCNGDPARPHAVRRPSQNPQRHARSS